MINALEMDADLEQAVQAAGGVTALINMAAKHDDSALVQVYSHATLAYTS